MMTNLLLVCIGGAIGSGARYLLFVGSLRWFGSSFPVGTLIANYIGCFLIGIFMYWGTKSNLLSEQTRMFLTTGCMGGLTTYSTFNYELLQKIQSGNWNHSVWYALLTMFGCLCLGFAGVWVGKMIAEQIAILR